MTVEELIAEVVAVQGQAEDGIKQIHQGLATTRATGAELNRPYHLALLAEAYGKAGQGEEGLPALAEALDLVNKTGERWYEAELHRLKGELTLAQSRVHRPPSTVHNPQSEAEECFRKAIEIARQQRAKLWELRAVMSLARLWQQQGKKDEARQQLAEIYGWFTEGFDTKDLQEAKALLEDLNR
jgi:predicted ATPase